VEVGIQMMRKLGMLNQIYHEPPSPPSPPVPEYARGCAFHSGPAAAPSDSGDLRAVALTGQPVSQGHDGAGGCDEIQLIANVGLLWCQSQPGWAKLMLGPDLTCKDLTGWLLSHGVPRERVNERPTKVLLELCIKESKHWGSQPVYGPGEEQLPPPPYSPPRSAGRKQEERPVRKLMLLSVGGE
uniref:Uncharacterized protein n=1 Tax=Spermophilus dauricus TaxID=99837 RepID=A0A8C9UU63_SPEDA